MPRLKCGVDTCMYWRDKLCIRKGIHVTGEAAHNEEDTNCDSFHQQNRESRNYNVEFATFGIDLHLRVDCEAVNCRFNDNRECVAKEIKIDGSRSKSTKDTFCSSFELQ